RRPRLRLASPTTAAAERLGGRPLLINVKLGFASMDLGRRGPALQMSHSGGPLHSSPAQGNVLSIPTGPGSPFRHCSFALRLTSEPRSSEAFLFSGWAEACPMPLAPRDRSADRGRIREAPRAWGRRDSLRRK